MKGLSDILLAGLGTAYFAEWVGMVTVIVIRQRGGCNKIFLKEIYFKVFIFGK